MATRTETATETVRVFSSSAQNRRRETTLEMLNTKYRRLPEMTNFDQSINIVVYHYHLANNYI